MGDTTVELSRTILLWFPDWPVVAALSAAQTSGALADGTALDPGAPPPPVALTETSLVFACSAAARAEGVRRGMRIREAQSRCSDLVVLPYDPVLDHRAFEPVIVALEEITPGVQIIRPGLCAIRARGPVRYYGGELEAAEAVLARLAADGLHGARIGIADGVFAAEQAAKLGRVDAGGDAIAPGASPADAPAAGAPSSASSSAPSAGAPAAAGAAHSTGLTAAAATSADAVSSAVAHPFVTIVAPGRTPAFLAPLPVSLVGTAAFATLLRRLGVTTLGGLAALGAHDVRSRFGEEGARAHLIASGLDRRRVNPRRAPETLDRVVEFEPPLDRIDQLAFGFRVAAEEFIQTLAAARLVCTALGVEISSERGEVSVRRWLHPRWFEPSDVVDRVRWQLQGSGTADTGLRSAVTRVRVVPEAVDDSSHHEQGLWGTAPEERVHHGLSRVQSMLGHEAVVTVAVGGGRELSERAILVPWGDRVPENARPAERPWSGSLPPPLPSTVFEKQHPVLVLDADGDAVGIDDRGTLTAEPARFSSTGAPPDLAGIGGWAGPWTVDERWWDQESARSFSRFQLVDGEGMAWLLVLEAGEWFAEARYD